MPQSQLVLKYENLRAALRAASILSGPQCSPATRVSDILQEVPSTDHGTLSNQEFTQEVVALLDVTKNRAGKQISTFVLARSDTLVSGREPPGRKFSQPPG